MTQALTITQVAQATGYEQGKLQLIKDTIARGASNDELMLFLHLAQRSGLDPFSRQIYLIERRANIDGKWTTTRQPQTGIDGLRLIADRTERYAPGREPTYAYDPDGRLLKATAYVKKWVRGEWHEVAASAHYDEYVQTKNDGSVTKMWADKPHIMLAKCAEALALRRAFPAEMSGLYTSDEVRDHSEDRAAFVVNPATGEIIDHVPALLAQSASYEPPAETAAHTPNGNGQRRQRTRDELIVRIAELTEEARGLDLEIELAKPLDEMTRDELIQHGGNLKTAIDAARAALVAA